MLSAFTAFRSTLCRYCRELATEEKMLLALNPMSRTVPTTITRMTAGMTAYSAMSWPLSSVPSPQKWSLMSHPPHRIRRIDRVSRLTLCNFVRNPTSESTNSSVTKSTTYREKGTTETDWLHHTLTGLQPSDNFLHIPAGIVPSKTLVFQMLQDRGRRVKRSWARIGYGGQFPKQAARPGV